MKILSLIRSVLLSRKRNCIMISLCFIFTTLLFNLMIAISSDYINGVNYISKNRYDRTAIVTHTTSLKPLSAQRISDELKRQGIKCRMEILNNAPVSFKDFSISGYAKRYRTAPTSFLSAVAVLVASIV